MADGPTAAADIYIYRVMDGVGVTVGVEVCVGVCVGTGVCVGAGVAVALWSSGSRSRSSRLL